MLDAFRDLFDTDQLREIYNKIDSKLIRAKENEIKSKLKEKIEHSLGRDIYKDILRKTINIKRKLSRKEKSLNVMIPIDVLEKCLPKAIDNGELSDRKKFRFVKQFCETLKSEVPANDFKKHDQYERIAGWLVGREPRLKFAGDGTVSINPILFLI